MENDYKITPLSISIADTMSDPGYRATYEPLTNYLYPTNRLASSLEITGINPYASTFSNSLAQASLAIEQFSNRRNIFFPSSMSVGSPLDSESKTDKELALLKRNVITKDSLVEVLHKTTVWQRFLLHEEKLAAQDQIIKMVDVTAQSAYRLAESHDEMIKKICEWLPSLRYLSLFPNCDKIIVISEYDSESGCAHCYIVGRINKKNLEPRHVYVSDSDNSPAMGQVVDLLSKKGTISHKKFSELTRISVKNSTKRSRYVKKLMTKVGLTKNHLYQCDGQIILSHLKKQN